MFSPRLPAVSGNAIFGSATLAVALLLLPALGRYAASHDSQPVQSAPAVHAVATPSVRPSAMPSLAPSTAPVVVAAPSVAP